ncbi:MAG: hypothetical protein SFT94_06130 [Pseudanabaenaceae cyanobacterium bins.68]|nr:hypothetical protein [Pseudanabaenaceae cyanobacterium bins.68]
MTLSSSQSPKLPRKRAQKTSQEISQDISSGSIRALNSAQTNSTTTSQVISLDVARLKAIEHSQAQHQAPHEDRPPEHSPTHFPRDPKHQTPPQSTYQVAPNAQASLQRLEMIKKTLMVITGVLGISLIGVHGHQQKLNKEWNDRNNDLEKLSKNKRELTVIIATLDYQAAQELAKNAPGYQPESLENVLILPHLLPATSNSKPNSKLNSKPNPTRLDNKLNPEPPIPTWLTDPNRKPLAY